MKRAVLLASILLAAAGLAFCQQEVHFGVLGLFHAHEIVLTQAGGEPLAISAGGAPSLVLNGEPSREKLVLRADGDRVFAGNASALHWTVSTRDGHALAFQLSVPGKIRREYRGTLTISAAKGEIIAVVTMDREIAVASIVTAEMGAQAPLEALKAQAIVTRSFLSAGARHSDYDFCDTTHCQFLRSPPPPDSNVWRAVRETQGLVLAYHGEPLAAMYSSRCGGRTHSLHDIGMESANGYPYYAVRCAYCVRHPVQWQSRIASQSPPQQQNERSRIDIARQWGWSAVPGSDFTVTRNADQWLLNGHSIGHGVGLCQYGAMGMAAAGANYHEILQHYYPNTDLIALE